MQAHPQSSPAARIRSTPSSTPHPRSIPHSHPLQLHTHGLLNDLPTPQPSSLAETAGLAHDAGNLLAALGLYCDLLNVPGVLGPEHRHYATELNLISNRSSELIQRLLAQYAATGQTKSPTKSSFHRNSTPAAANSTPNYAYSLHSLAPILQSIALDAASVSVDCPASLPSLNVPTQVIERITVNLVRNAAEALRTQRSSPQTNLPHCGQIRVTLAIIANRLQLSVEDNGPGIPTSIASAFLRPSPLGPGVNHGLGHRIVHELATTTGAQISIRVRPGNGTVFCLKWPLPNAALVETTA